MNYNSPQEEQRLIRVHQIHEQIAALNSQRTRINQEIDDLSKELENLRVSTKKWADYSEPGP